jgi:4-amino-4-deoxy-L-arabinose transferase-like glycosyltransferase
VWAMSEPVFLLTGFAGLALLAAYLARPRAITLAMAALLIGLAFLSRYLGVAFILAGALVLLLMPVSDEEPFLHRLRRSLVFGAIAALPMVIWLALDYFSSGTIGGRSGMPAEMFLPRFFGTFAALQPIVLFWLLPESVANRLPDIVQMLLFLLPFVFLRRVGRLGMVKIQPHRLF